MVRGQRNRRLNPAVSELRRAGRMSGRFLSRRPGMSPAFFVAQAGQESGRFFVCTQAGGESGFYRGRAKPVIVPTYFCNRSATSRRRVES
jgi:hypothetical protein